MRTCFVLLLVAGLAGCAADVKRADALSPISTYADTRNRLLVNFQGDASVTATPGWTRLTSTWRRILADRAASSDYQLGEQAGAVTITALPATLLVVEVDRLRQQADGDGLGKGSLRVNVRFTDGPSGRLMGSRRYESESAEPAALEGQLKDISKAIIEEVESAQRIAKRDPLPEAPMPASRWPAGRRRPSRWWQWRTRSASCRSCSAATCRSTSTRTSTGASLRSERRRASVVVPVGVAVLVVPVVLIVLGLVAQAGGVVLEILRGILVPLMVEQMLVLRLGEVDVVVVHGAVSAGGVRRASMLRPRRARAKPWRSRGAAHLAISQKEGHDVFLWGRCRFQHCAGSLACRSCGHTGASALRTTAEGHPA